MSVIRSRALALFAERVGNCVPELKGKVCGGHAESPKRLSFPHLSVRAIRFRYFPDQPSDYCHIGASAGVFYVGRVEGTIQLRLGAQTANRRYALEQELLEKVFWADLEHPGIVLFTIPDCHDAQAAFELDETLWDDEKAFDKKWYSVATAELQLPALVTKGSVHTIEEIRLTLAEDLTSSASEIPDGSMETVSIDENGNLTPAANP